MKNEIRAKLKERAIIMAQEPEDKKVTSAMVDVIAFTLVTETYGIETAFVREVCPLWDYTQLPGVPSYILGIISVRGQILPVVNLKKLFNLPEKGLGELNKVIILSNGQMEFGILADEVHGTQSIKPGDIQVVPPTVTGIGEKYLKGVTNEHIVVLEAENILNDKKIIVKEHVI